MATLPHNQAGSEADIENKDAIDMRVFEAGQPTDVDAKHVEQTESALVGVSLLHAARLFWRPSAVCVIIAFSTVLNGYQASVSGGSAAALDELMIFSCPVVSSPTPDTRSNLEPSLQQMGPRRLTRRTFQPGASW